MSTITNDPFAAVRAAGTAAPNFELDTDAIVAHMATWQPLCNFTVRNAEADSVDIEFATLPQDMDAFARDLYEFCPDLVDQGTGCVHEMVEALEELGEDLSPEMAVLTEGVDFSDENYGLEILSAKSCSGIRSGCGGTECRHNVSPFIDRINYYLPQRSRRTRSWFAERARVRERLCVLCVLRGETIATGAFLCHVELLMFKLPRMR